MSQRGVVTQQKGKGLPGFKALNCQTNCLLISLLTDSCLSELSGQSRKVSRYLGHFPIDIMILILCHDDTLEHIVSTCAHEHAPNFD